MRVLNKAVRVPCCNFFLGMEMQPQRKECFFLHLMLYLLISDTNLSYASSVSQLVVSGFHFFSMRSAFARRYTASAWLWSTLSCARATDSLNKTRACSIGLSNLRVFVIAKESRRYLLKHPVSQSPAMARGHTWSWIFFLLGIVQTLLLLTSPLWLCLGQDSKLQFCTSIMPGKDHSVSSWPWATLSEPAYNGLQHLQSRVGTCLMSPTQMKH